MEEEEEDLTCGICQDIMDRPVRMVCCTAPLCYECLQNFAENGDNNKCPFDRKRITRHSLKRSLQNVDDRLWKRCQRFKALKEELANSGLPGTEGTQHSSRSRTHQELEAGELRRHLQTLEERQRAEREEKRRQEEEATLKALREDLTLRQESQMAFKQLELIEACRADEELARRLQQKFEKDQAGPKIAEIENQEKKDEELARRLQEKLERKPNRKTPNIQDFFKTKEPVAKSSLQATSDIRRKRKREVKQQNETTSEAQSIDQRAEIVLPAQYEVEEAVKFEKKASPQHCSDDPENSPMKKSKKRHHSCTSDDESSDNSILLSPFAERRQITRWPCELCTFVNNSSVNICEVCGSDSKKVVLY